MNKPLCLLVACYLSYHWIPTNPDISLFCNAFSSESANQRVIQDLTIFSTDTAIQNTMLHKYANKICKEYKETAPGQKFEYEITSINKKIQFRYREPFPGSPKESSQLRLKRFINDIEKHAPNDDHVVNVT